ncbi:MAG: DNA translocase FtsK 4TM domain-containing protein [Myxococcales bacterium]|nr:DNA translocase FtsK 4TM domain-containing protein [Myxococcales bacterium]
MAARRARAEKSVLSRQRIAVRKRAIQDQKLKAPGVGRRAIAAVFLAAASILCLLAVGTYDAQDRVGPGFHNAVGPVGHAMAEALRGLWGVCAYLLPAAGLYAALAALLGSRERRRWPQLACLAVLSVGGAVLAQLVMGGAPEASHPPGGAIGRSVAEVLCGLFSVVGTVVVVSALCVAALIVGTRLGFLRACAVLWRWTAAAARRSGELLAAAYAAQREALRARREAAQKAREEEAAFLASLEADEEKVLEAEREAAEAEQVAEEAHRLARAAEEARAQRKREKEEARMSEPPPSLGLTLLGPGADPAWAASLAPPPRAESQPPKKRRSPILALSPEPAAEAPPPGPKPAPAPPLAVEPAKPLLELALPPPSPALATPRAIAAAARTPVIVEPKAPPKPSRKKEQEQFEFVGDRKSFTPPPIEVLEFDRKERSALDKEAFFSTAERLRAKLADFGIDGEVVEIRPGPVVTMYEFLPGPGIKISKIASLADDLAMAMEAMRVRIVAPIPGKGVVGIEVPNRDRETVYLKEIAEQDAFQKSTSRLTMCVGKDIEGMPYVLDLAKAPHLLIAGTTGSGKSVAVNSMIMSILLKSTPEEVRFIMVDPKMLELSVYEGIPHLLLPVVTDPKKAALALRWAVEEMERRYHLLSEAGVRHIAGYNKQVEQGSEEAEPKPKKEAEPEKKPAAPAKPKKKLLIVDVAEGESEEEALARANQGGQVGVPSPNRPEEIREAVEAVEAEVAAAEAEGQIRVDEATLSAESAESAEAGGGKPERKKLPYIVVIIDELADLMMVASREVETYIARLAQMARAAGIHLMLATQRPSTDVVTGVIKANFPTRVSFMLRAKPDSMTILGTVGAEALLGMGDMLIMPPNSAHLQRVHGAFVSETEIKRAVDHLKAQGKPVYDESILKPRDEELEGGGEDDELSDELYDQALAVVAEMRTVSISMLQRKMRIGYNRAARMIERMERDGLVGPADGAKPREVLIRPVGEMPGAGAM